VKIEIVSKTQLNAIRREEANFRLTQHFTDVAYSSVLRAGFSPLKMAARIGVTNPDRQTNETRVHL